MKFSVLSLSLSFLLMGLSVPAFAARSLSKLEVSNVQPGSIVIRYNERALYFVLSGRQAYRYPVAVPKAGMQWWGAASVVSKHNSPDWSPPNVVRRANPSLPSVIAGGSPNNPMGTRVIMLNLPEIAIHGTSSKMRSSMGKAASFGCIRMLNEDIEDLFSRVSSGTQVLMLK